MDEAWQRFRGGTGTIPAMPGTTKILAPLAVLALLAGCGDPEKFKTGITYTVTVAGTGTFLVLGENITKNADGSWALRDVSSGVGGAGRGTVRVPAGTTVTVKLQK